MAWMFLLPLGHAQEVRQERSNGLSSFIQLIGHGRGVNASAPMPMDAREIQWTAEHRVLTVGILPNELVPFDVLGLSNEYEGISADYLDAIASALGVQLRVRALTSNEDALAALMRGEVDLLPTMQAQNLKGLSVRGQEAVALSSAYFPVRHVQVVASGHTLVNTDEINVGYVPGHVTAEALRRAFPRARLAAYGSTFLGLTAAAAGKIDVFIANGASAAYLIDQYQLSTLRLMSFAETPDSTVHFAMRHEDAVLLRLVDRALAAMPARARNEIRVRWTPTDESSEPEGRVSLSDAERQWIAANPLVRYATVDDRIPFMFVNQAGNFHGLSVQVMDLIASKTGLDFEPLPPELRGAAKSKPDVLPVVARGSHSLPGVAISDTYFQGYWVVISRSGDSDFLRLDDLAGKRIAYLAPNGVVERIKERVPSVQLVPVESFAASYEQVASGRADVTVGNINTASYFLQQGYGSRLKVAGAIDDAPIDIAFGVRADAPELLSIVNKALQSISPEEMRRLRANWMFMNHPAASDWRQYASWFLMAGAGLLACIVLFAIWNWSLQRQVRRRQAAEAELREQLAFQHAMLDGIPHALAVRDLQTRLIFCNKSYCDMFGVMQQAMEGKTFLEANPLGNDVKQAQYVQERFKQVVTEGKASSDDLDVDVAGQHRKIFHWMAPIVLEEGGACVAIIAGAIDITERYHLLELVEAARAKAEAANRAKSNFLATMSHEIRTPMNAVMGVLELLVREGHLTPQDRESAELAHNSAHSLLGLINDILDISKIEAGGLEIVPRPAQLRLIVQEVAQVFEPLARQHGLTITVKVDSAVAQWHAIDAPRFRQIVNNLVSNAIKYTDAGGVQLRLRHLGEADAVETIQLEVQDSGIGIAAEDIQNLFQPFFQAESAGPRSVGGTGLGLPIVQRLCMQMGGEISVESQRGQGTCVRVILRLVTLPPPSALESAPALIDDTVQSRSARGRFKILLVDDHPANRLLLQRQLDFLGYSWAAAENGADALALWRQGGIDLVITDCSMPVMDGYQLTAAIRALETEQQRSRCPVLGCTAHVQEEDRRRALDVGMDECLMKPIGVDDLLEALQRHLNTGPSETETSPPPLTPVSPALQMLSEQVFDPQSLHSFSGGDAAVELNFLHTLLSTNKEDLHALQHLHSEGLFQEVAACVHKIKGAVRIILAQEAVHACDAVERAAKRHDTAALDAAMALLTPAMERLGQAMEHFMRERGATISA